MEFLFLSSVAITLPLYAAFYPLTSALSTRFCQQIAVRGHASANDPILGH